MERSAATDPGYEEFFAATVPSLRRLAAARTGSWATADDVVQEVMSDAFRRWDRIGGYDDPAAWARRAVLNRSISRWRHRDRERRATDALAARAGVSGGDHDEPHLTDTELWTAIRSLSPRQAEVVLLLWFEQMTAAEAAATLGCGEDTVRTHWRRARSRLAEALGEHDDRGGTPPTAPEDDR